MGGVGAEFPRRAAVEAARGFCVNRKTDLQESVRDQIAWGSVPDGGVA
jgi:hypothetical protein